MIFDAHGDILTDLYESNQKGLNNRFREKHYPIYLQGGITHSIFVNWTDPYQKTKHDFDQTFDVAIKALNDCSDIVKICYTYEDVKNAQQEQKLGVILGIEGLKYLDKPEDIVKLYHLGVRHAIITWNEGNDYATGVSETEHGLKEKGKKLLYLMQAHHMIIDVSHANPKTFDDVMDYTKGPIIVSHGNAKALCNHRRNYTDDQLLKIKQRNGVIGVCAVPNFISSDPSLQTVEHLAEHIDYIVKKIGIEHVGLGLDVYYYLMPGQTSTGVKGLETLADTKNLVDVLTQKGFTKDQIDHITHLNFDRILKDVLK